MQLLCAGCGKSFISTGRGDMDDQHCEDCNDSFYAAMAREFPHGQCPQCGAAGREWTCSQGKVHIVFSHVEGACSSWSDREPIYDDDGNMACDLGCAPEARRRVYMPIRSVASPDLASDDSDELPF
jgi:hypothetical protein